jgi:ribosomal protein L11 methyltransferase
MDYMELHFKFLNKSVESEVLIAQLAYLGYEGFEERGQELLAYIPAQNYSPQQINGLPQMKNHPGIIQFTNRLLKDKNWNSLWEKNYTPVVFPGRCVVRAPFHPKATNVALDIIIEPKMAFGTAHHDTTRMMVEWLLIHPPTGLTVLDMGCGTGILAIVAATLGAGDITAIDNDHWACENTLANAEKNNVEGISVYLGDAGLITAQHYDLIMANINRNTLVTDMPSYARGLRKNGTLAVSGFYQDDLPMIKHSGIQAGLTFTSHTLRNEWVMALFGKQQQSEQ